MRAAPLFCLVALLTTALPATADDVPPSAKGESATKVTTIEGVDEYRLGNGLRVVLAPDGTKPTTTVNVTYQVGSRMERYGETGMAHLLEHLLFKGTPAYPGQTIVEEFAKRGMRYNGSTWYDRTNYFETFAANDDNLDWALKMEADRMVHSNIWRQDLDSEMTVVRNEMESGENHPDRILWEKMTASAYQWHNYGKSTIGARADVENVNIEHLQAFYRSYYQPDNAVLIVTGKFDEARVLARIGQYFGAIAKPGRALEPLWTVEPVQDGPRAVTLERVGDTQIVGALYHIAQAASPDFAALRVLGQIFGNAPNGRLYKALVDKKLAAGVSELSMPLHDPGYAIFFAELDKSQSRDKAAKAMLDVLEGVKKAPITEVELKRAQRAILNSYEKLLDDPAQFGIRLSESIATGDWRLFFLQRDRVAAVTLADLQRVADNYYKPSNRTFGQFIPTAAPDRAITPQPVDVAAALADYRGKDALAEGEAFDPSPANIEKRVTRSRLKNGMQVALLPKQTRGNSVAGVITLDLGDAASLSGKKILGVAVGRSLNDGAGKLNHQQIADRFQELKATYTIQGGGDRVSIHFQAKRDTLPELLDLLADLLRRPTFPAAELDKTKAEWLTEIDSQRHQPDAIARNALGRFDNPYPKGDIRYAETFDEQAEAVKAVTVDGVRSFHAAFYGAADGEIALVGDFDAAAAADQLQRLFGDWRARKPYARVPHPYRASPAASQSFETPDKANAFYMAGLAMAIRDDDPAFTAIVIANHVLGGGGLKSRLMDRLRQKDGISYGGGSGLSPNAFEANSGLYLSAIYAPQNLDKLKAGVADVLTALLRDGITEQELADAKSGLLQAAAVARSQDAGLAGQLSQQLHVNRTMAFTESREAAIQAATIDEVNAALKRVVDLDHLVQIYAGDFAGAAAKAAGAAGH